MPLLQKLFAESKIDSMQVARLEKFFENGKASGAEVSQQKATLAQSRLTATQAQNNLQLALLALSQLLELPSPEDFTVARPNTEKFQPIPNDPNQIYEEALLFKPEVRAEQLRLDASEKSIKVAQAGLYPSLSLNGGLQTNYYKTSGMQQDNFGTQIKNNFSQYIGLHIVHML